MHVQVGLAVIYEEALEVKSNPIEYPSFTASSYVRHESVSSSLH